MESALGWIGDVFSALLKLVPRRVVVTPAQEVVAFRYGCYVSLLTHENGLWLPHLGRLLNPFRWFQFADEAWIFQTGIHVYWPLVTEITEVDVTDTPMDCAAIYATTRDGVPMCFQVVVLFRVVDSVLVCTKYPEFTDHVDELAYACFADAICGVTADEITSSDMLPRVTKTLRAELKKYGIKVVRCSLGSRQQVTPVAFWGIAHGVSE